MGADKRQTDQRAWQRRKARVKAAAQALIRELGGRCTVCATTEALSIEHLDGKSYESRDLSWSQRVTRYWQEFRDGVPLTVLCLSCNTRAVSWRRQGWTPKPGSKLFDVHLAAMQYAKWIEEYESARRPNPNEPEPEPEPGSDDDDEKTDPGRFREAPVYFTGEGEDGCSPVHGPSVGGDDEPPF